MELINNFRFYLLDEEFRINVYKNKVNIINYKDIVDFSDTNIKVKYSDGIIIIIGKKLSIAKLLIDEVLIIGNIDSIEFR